MDEIVKEMKAETFYGIQKYNWPEKYAKRVYNYSVGNVFISLLAHREIYNARLLGISTS
jgi:hypothetical protein